MFFFKDNYDRDGNFRFDKLTKNCRFKGGSSSTTTYTPTEEEKRLMKLQGDYFESMLPTANWAQDTAKSLLQGSYGTSGTNYNNLSNEAQQQIGAANATVSDLTQGKLPQEYIDNMTSVINQGVQKTMGTALNDMSKRGVINSSVMAAANKDMADSVANAMASGYQQNIGLLSGLAGQQVDQSTAKIAADASAREADLYAPLSLMGLVTGVGSVGSGALAGVAGKGSTTTTQKQSGGLLSGLFGGLF